MMNPLTRITALFASRAGWRVLANLWRAVAAAHRKSAVMTRKRPPFRVWVLEHDATQNGRALYADRAMMATDADDKISLTDSAFEAAQFLTRREAREAQRTIRDDCRRRFRAVKLRIK